MRHYLQIFISLLILLLISSCDSNPWSRDISTINYSPEVQRFDADFFEIGKDGFNKTELIRLNEKYPKFLSLYFQGVLNLGDIQSEETIINVNKLVSNSDVQQVYMDVASQFPKGALDKDISEIKDALKLYSFYFPERALPELYTLISMFSYNVVVDQGVLGISLEMYLGGEYKYYPSTNIPKYRFKNFSKEFISCDAVKAFLISEFDKEAGMNLLEQMIFYGKIAYLQAALLSNQETRLFFNYDEPEISWCEENESEIWFHLVDMELLYTGETEKIRKYIDDAPFIPGFPEGSTAKVGKWLGYKIVKSYMENNKDVDLVKLMSNEDANQILLKSKYKPKR